MPGEKDTKKLMIGEDHSPIVTLPTSVFNSRFHVGAEVTITASGNPSVIVIPDITSADGFTMYITGPIILDGANLKKFLDQHHVTLPNSIADLTKNTKISCDAFYYSSIKKEYKSDDLAKLGELQKKMNFDDKEKDKFYEWLNEHGNPEPKLPESASMTTLPADHTVYKIEEGPLLMMFTIEFKEGLITSLTHGSNIGDLFDITRGSVRIVRCPQDRQDVLKEYVKRLQEGSW